MAGQRAAAADRGGGGLPERTPLNARSHGVVEREHYVIEKLSFESHGGIVVSANRYRPRDIDASTRLPAFITPIGHWAQGKCWEDYQRLGRELAAAGVLVLVYDGVGQGERWEYVDPLTGLDVGGTDGTVGHTLLAYSTILTGQTLAAHFLWDGIRAVDYVTSRGNVDPSRIGVMGASGGGTMTQLIAAVDERVTLSIPVGSVVTKGEMGGPEGELWIAAQYAARLWTRDFWWMVVPRPQLVLTSSDDTDTWSSPGKTVSYADYGRQSLQEVRRGYELFGASENAAVVEAPGRHGMPKAVRGAAYTFIESRWPGVRRATAIDDPIEHCDVLALTETGQLVTTLDAPTMLEMNRRRAASFRAARKRQASRSVLADAVGLLQPKTPRIAFRSGPASEDGLLTPVTLTSAHGVETQALHFRPARPSRRAAVLVLLDDRGKDFVLARRAEIDPFLDAGAHVLAVDLSGVGSSSATASVRGPYDLFSNPAAKVGGSATAVHYIFSPAAVLARTAIAAGTNMTAIRVADVEAAVAYARAAVGAGDARISIVGRGECGVTALIASAILPDIDTVVAQRTIATLELLAGARYFGHSAAVFIPGFLRHGDLPDVAAQSRAARVRIVNAVDAEGKRLPLADARALYQRAGSRAEVVTCDERGLSSRCALPTVAK